MSSRRAVLALRRIIREVGADVVYVNTMIIPWWITAARLSGAPVVCHVHEAKDSHNRAVLAALCAPLLQATVIMANSQASIDALTTALPRLRRRIQLVYNGILGPDDPPRQASPPDSSAPFRLVAVCRLSPRKAPDVAPQAVAQLVAGGRNVVLNLCGTTFEGYEWFEEQLRHRAEQDDLRGRVTFAGYVSPVWPALAEAHAVVAPSLREPFGNAVVEAQLALRPVVASAGLGHLETVTDGRTGLLVPPGDAVALAAAVARLIDHPDLAWSLAEAGRSRALERFSVDRYRADVIRIVAGVAGEKAPGGPGASWGPATARPG